MDKSSLLGYKGMVNEETLARAFRILAARAGSAKSKAKAAAARKNGELGGRPRKYPKCPRYATHSFSPVSGKCPCGFKKPAVKS
jgi:hypothetical protein